ncbi:hypothetical protein INR49_012110 [Caranx melampygus]|nr:hypothetical protein INR49_012110 [Caranx melampygus]
MQGGAGRTDSRQDNILRMREPRGKGCPCDRRRVGFSPAGDLLLRGHILPPPGVTSPPPD